MMMIFLILYTVCGALVTLITFIYFKLVRPQKKLHNVFRDQGVPCEKFVPIFGQLFDMNRAKKQDKGLEYFCELARKHGLVFFLNHGPMSRLELLDPDLIADVLSRSKDEIYQKPTFFINVIKNFVGLDILFLSSHDRHDRTRKLLNPAFHSINLKSVVSIISHETKKAIDSLTSISLKTDGILLNTEIDALALSIIVSSAFGQTLETIPFGKEIVCRTFNTVREILEYRTVRMINQVKILDQLPFWGRNIVDKCVTTLNEFVRQAIIDRRNDKSTSMCFDQDILGLILSITDSHGESLSDEQIIHESLGFIFAGHDTTGNLISWALYNLIVHDSVLKACREEVDRVLPDGIIPNYDHLVDLHVIEAVLYETLRLYPSATVIGRQSIRGHTISTPDGKRKIYIPKDTMVMINTYSLHRREEFWPEPSKFDYKRWMRDPLTGLKPKLPHPFAYLPFGAGPRNCIGQNFALIEAKIILAMFLQHCEFELIPGQKIVADLKGATMSSKYGIRVTIKRRKNCST